MMIIGVDFHPEFQQIASVDTETGEFHLTTRRHSADPTLYWGRLAGSVRDDAAFLGAKMLPVHVGRGGNAAAGMVSKARDNMRMRERTKMTQAVAEAICQPECQIDLSSLDSQLLPLSSQILYKQSLTKLS
jgi:hypothetical protein